MRFELLLPVGIYHRPQVWLIHGEGRTILAMVGWNAHHRLPYCDLELLDSSLPVDYYRDHMEDLQYPYQCNGARYYRVKQCLDRASVHLPHSKTRLELRVTTERPYSDRLSVRFDYNMGNTIGQREVGDPRRIKDSEVVNSDDMASNYRYDKRGTHHQQEKVRLEEVFLRTTTQLVSPCATPSAPS